MKKIFILAICFMLLISLPVFAGETWSLGQSATPTGLESNLDNTAATILGTMQWVGYLIAILMLIWAGIRFTTSSAAEKVKAKETLLPMVIGAILIAGASTIAHFIFNL